MGNAPREPAAVRERGTKSTKGTKIFYESCAFLWLKFRFMRVTDREPLFQTLFERSPDALFIEDMEGKVLDCNPAAAALHGMPREHVIGKNVTELVPPGYRSQIITLGTDGPAEFEGLSLSA